MLKNYFKIALRNLAKYKGYSFINIAGLAIGMACCLLIFLYVQDELSYDRYHDKADRIYRVIEEVRLEGVGEESASMPFPTGETLPIEYPNEIEAAVRFYNFQAPTLLVEYGNTGEKRFDEPRFFFADPQVFQVFSFEMIHGDPQSALTEPNSVVITEAMAQKYFEDEDPMGEILRFVNQFDFRVTGVVKNVPQNSHFQYDFLASFSSLRRFYGGNLPRGWYWNPCWTFILLKEGVSSSDLEARFPELVQKYFPDSIKDKTVIKLQALTDIHLHSHLDYEINPNSDISYVYIFSAVAIFVLIVACINFMNLATARSSNRSREVGMRKVLGAYRTQLIRQFFGESILLSFIAALFSLLIVEILLPTFNAFSGKELALNLFGGWRLFTGLITIAIAVGILSGFYPALFLSGFHPVKVFRGGLHKGRTGSIFRKVLVVGQFAISIILIIGTVVTFQQLNFLRNKRLGFNKDQVVMVQSFGTGISAWYEGFKNQLLQDPHILQVTGMEDVLGAKYQSSSFIAEGSLETQMQQIPRLAVVHDFVETFEMDMVSGRSFSKEFPTDVSEGLIINEAAAKRFGWSPEEAIGKRIRNQNQLQMRVIGVVKNFNYASLDQAVTPFMLEMPRNLGQMNAWIRYIGVKINPADIRKTLSFIQSKWESVVSNRTFDYFFLDNELNKLYDSQEKMGKVFSAFAFLAIVIACLGLFALASFTAELRTKEIGIRKVLGAPVPGIVLLLSKEFTKWVFIANLIAWPVAYYAMHRWLQSFAYQIAIGLSVFFLAAVLAIIIALLTVSYQAIKAALTDPVKALRSE